MRQTASLVILTSILPLTAAAQLTEAPAMPAFPRPHIVWQDGAANSSRTLIQGLELRIVQAPDAMIAAVVASDKDVTQILLGVRNDDSTSWDFYPDSLHLEVTAPYGRPLAYMSPSKVAKKLQNLSVWEAIALGLTAASEGYKNGQARRTSGTATTYSSTGASSITTYEATTTPPPPGTPQTDALTASLAADKDKKAAAALNGVFLANTLAPRQLMTGVVHFERRGGVKELRLTVTSKGYDVSIPLVIPKK